MMPKRCDISPIEYLWAFLKNYCYFPRKKIKNKDDLWKICCKYWLSPEMDEIVEKVIKFVPRRVKKLD